jgi:translocation and assembly module TamB
LQFAADNPLAWAPESHSLAHSTLSLSGKIARVSAGRSRAALEALRLFAERAEPDRYLLDLETDATAFAARGRSLPGGLRSELRVDMAPVAGKLALTAALRGLTRADLDLGAQLDRERGRVSYRGAFAAEPLTPLAALAMAALPEAAPYRIALQRLRVRLDGELSGVLQSGPELVPRAVADPLPRLRGKQATAFELAGLALRAPDRTLDIPGLAVALESQHGERGAGSARTRVRLTALDYEGGGTAVRLRGLEHQLAAKFDRVPGQGLADLHSQLTLASAAQSWLPGYPVSALRWTTDLQLDRLLSAYLRDLQFDNPGGGTSLRASGALELTSRNGVVTASRALVGREALSLTGQLKQELEPLERAGSTARSSGTFALPFRLESGGLLGYRFLATLQANDVSFLTKDQSLAVDGLNAQVPIVEEIALLPGGLVLGVDPRSSPLADARFFDVHPFLATNDYVTADAIRIGSLPVLGPLAANLRIERTGFILEQLQVGYSGGQIVGQSRVAYRDGDPIVRLRLNATGLRSPKTGEIFDANATLNFEPVALTLDGKMQIVRASRAHVLEMLKVLDPYRQSPNANRVRAALAVGYPKFVRFKLHDGTVDTKIELGGMAQLVRIGEIKAVPLGPLLQRYVAPRVNALLPPRPEHKPALTGSVASSSGGKSDTRAP